MSRAAALAVLVTCALLEAGGDALIRKGLHARGASPRLLCYFLGAVVLFAYGWMVNRPPWSFGKLLGIYVVCFFLVAQGISWVVFGERPSTGTLAGGMMIVGGGLVIAVWR